MEVGERDGVYNTRAVLVELGEKDVVIKGDGLRALETDAEGEDEEFKLGEG